MKTTNKYQSKKETEKFIWANMRILSQETILQKALRTVPLIRGQSTVIYILDKGLYIKWCNDSLYNPDLHVESESWVIMTPDRIKEEGYLLRGCDPWWD